MKNTQIEGIVLFLRSSCLNRLILSDKVKTLNFFASGKPFVEPLLLFGLFLALLTKTPL